MRGMPVLLVIAAASVWVSPAYSQSWFSRKSKAPPAQRVGELIGIVKADPEERKRSSAAQELRDYDAKAFPEIIPILVDVLQSDGKASVRLEAAQSLGKLRPLSQFAGQALEQAAARDESWRVRWQARSSLMLYHMAGFTIRGKSKSDASVIASGPNETPLTQNTPIIIVEEGKTDKKSVPVTNVSPSSNPPYPRPLPSFSTAMPNGGPAPRPIIIDTPTTPVSTGEDGPALSPQK